MFLDQFFSVYPYLSGRPRSSVLTKFSNLYKYRSRELEGKALVEDRSGTNTSVPDPEAPIQRDNWSLLIDNVLQLEERERGPGDQPLSFKKIKVANNESMVSIPKDTRPEDEKALRRKCANEEIVGHLDLPVKGFSKLSNRADLELLNKLVREKQVGPIFLRTLSDVRSEGGLEMPRCFRHTYAEVRWEIVAKLNEIATPYFQATVTLSDLTTVIYACQRTYDTIVTI